MTFGSSLLLALLFLLTHATALGNAACPSIEGKTLKSDPDGTGPLPYPTDTCHWIITCPDDTAVVLTQFAGKKSQGNSWFTMNIKPRLFSTNLIVYDPPYQNDWSLTNVAFYTNEIWVEFKNEKPDATNPAGGFSMTWKCQKSCTLVDTNPTTFNLPERKGRYSLVKSASKSEPEVCTVNLSPGQLCQPYEMVAYDMITVPEFPASGKTDPGWRVIFGPGTDPMNLGIYPNDYAARELFYSPIVAPLIIRSLPDKEVNVTIDYVCTPIANCTVTPTGKLDFPAAMILSDKDGAGPFEYGPGPLDCAWDVMCPYDTNVWMPHLKGGLDTNNNDVVTVTPRLGLAKSYSRRSLDVDPKSWAANTITVGFHTKQNTNWYPGFTLKYECKPSCAVASPQQTSLDGSKGSISGNVTAPETYASICRTEYVPQCSDFENSLQLSVVKQPALGAESWWMIIDRAQSEFEYVYPNRDLANELFIPSTPFNFSVRAEPTTAYDYQIDYECQNATSCWAQQDGSGGGGGGSSSNNREEILPWKGGLILSDSDGQGPQPYGQSNCTWYVRCTRGSSISVDGIDGYIRSSDSLTVEGTSSASTLHGPTISIPAYTVKSRQMTVRFVADAPGPYNAGFRLKFTCFGPDPFCGVAENCSANAISASLSPDGDGCFCHCRNAWSGKRCLACASNFNKSDDCASCTAGYEEYPSCYPYYFVETRWRLRFKDDDGKNFTKRAQYWLASRFAADLAKYLLEDVNCSRSASGITDRDGVEVGPKITIVDYSQTHFEVPIKANSPTDAYLTSRCVENALSSASPQPASSAFDPTEYKAYLKSLDDKVPASASETRQYTLRQSVCGSEDANNDGERDGCPPPPFLSAAPEDNKVLLIAAIAGGILGLLLIILLILCLLKFCGVAFKEKDWPVFNDPAKFTKGFGFVADDELMQLSSKRDTGSGADGEMALDDPLLAPSASMSSPKAAAAAAAATTAGSASAASTPVSSPPAQEKKKIEIDDLFGDDFGGGGEEEKPAVEIGDDI